MRVEKYTFVIVDEVDEDQEGDVEIHLREERSPTGFTSRGRQTGVQLSRAWNKLRWVNNSSSNYM